MAATCVGAIQDVSHLSRCNTHGCGAERVGAIFTSGWILKEVRVGCQMVIQKIGSVYVMVT